jgi:hypothetical protein
MLDGTVLVSKLSFICTYVSPLIFDISLGIVPVREFEYRVNATKFFIRPMELGMVPSKQFEFRYKLISFVNLLREDGIVLVSLFE